MATEKEVLKALTDKLVKVAKWPNQRSKFVVAWHGEHGGIFYFYKNAPKMSNVEYTTLIYYYILKLRGMKKDEKVQDIIDKCEKLLEQIGDKCNFYEAATFVYAEMYRYYSRIGDEERAYECHKKWQFGLTQMPGGADEGLLNEFLSLLEQRGDKQQVVDVVNDCNRYIEEQKRKLGNDESYEGWEGYVHSVYEYVSSKNGLLDEEHRFILIAILQINGIIKLPKREKSKKGSFDYNYAKAEKGDKEYQLLVAKAYREGDGVPKNIRLANLWEGFANNKIVE
ncbi:MAG: hypothetical protein K2J84_10510 [Bacteroidaceae bacterium]|nr:hypothetical protein [Bacteroidaceae bacterium]